MVKRKRSESSPILSDAVHVVEKLLNRQKKAVSTRLAAAQQPLVAALRLGAGFERQKHSRRKKTAVQKRDAKALTRLDDEYRVLKALDLDKVAEQHVRRTIARVKTLKDHEALPEEAKQVEKADLAPTRLNVLARLYKVAAVKKEVDALINDLKDIVGGSDPAKSARVVRAHKSPDRLEGLQYGSGNVPAAAGEPIDMLDISDEDSVAARLFNARIAAPSSGEESDDDLADSERPPSVDGGDSHDDSDSDMINAAAGLSAASGSDAASFDGFSDDASKPGAHSVRFVATTSDADGSDPVPSSPYDAASKSQSSRDTARPSTSTFLPGLSHAAYFSGDESASDLDEKPRKNRRGQRARQKLAERKYGAKAKHIEKNERKQGWDAKRGAVSSDAKPGNRKDRRAAQKDLKTKRGHGPVISGENAAPVSKRRTDGSAGKQAPKSDDTGSLHPSWVAAKAAKESKKLKIDLRGAKSATKITFD